MVCKECLVPDFSGNSMVSSSKLCLPISRMGATLSSATGMQTGPKKNGVNVPRTNGSNTPMMPPPPRVNAPRVNASMGSPPAMPSAASPMTGGRKKRSGRSRRNRRKNKKTRRSN